MILTENDCLKIIDFEGCSIDGGLAGACYEWFSYRTSTPTVSRHTDIFAYGCVIYEIITGKPPYHEPEKSDDPTSLVEELYKNNQFPNVTHLPLGDLMQGCWHGTFNSMTEIIQTLEAASALSLKARFSRCFKRNAQKTCTLFSASASHITKYLRLNDDNNC